MPARAIGLLRQGPSVVPRGERRLTCSSAACRSGAAGSPACRRAAPSMDRASSGWVVTHATTGDSSGALAPGSRLEPVEQTDDHVVPFWFVEDLMAKTGPEHERLVDAAGSLVEQP
jgi:hypothetical protein